jgi:hypothetical protein
MKATHYMEKVIHLLNSDNSLSDLVGGQRSAAIATLGCLRDAGSFHGEFDPYAGYSTWVRQFREEGGHSATQRLEDLQLIRQAAAEQMHGQARDLLLENLDRQLGRLGGSSGTALPYAEILDLSRKADFARQVRDTSLYMDGERSTSLQGVLEDADPEPEYQARLRSAIDLLPKLGISDLRYVDSIPMTTALIGFTRGTYRPGETKLNLYVRREGGIDVYVSQSMTEGIWVQLDPARTLQWLSHTTGVATSVGESFPQALKTLQERFSPNAIGTFGEFTDAWSQNHFALLHTLSHLFVKAAGRLSGLEQEGIGEEIMPYTNSLLIYGNHSGDFVLGGLLLLMEHHMATVLSTLREDAHRCIYNPTCEGRNSACHGCVHVSEVSCAHFNRSLGRRLLVGTGGFWA